MVPVKCVVRIAIPGKFDVIAFCSPHAPAAISALTIGCSTPAAANSNNASASRTPAWRGPV